MTINADRATVELTGAEVALLENAILDVCYGTSLPVEEWEFPTRMGGLERGEAITLAEQLGDLFGRPSSDVT